MDPSGFSPKGKATRRAGLGPILTLDRRPASCPPLSPAIQGGFIGLAIIGVLISLVSAYYYLRVVVTIYMQDGDPGTAREPWPDLTWGLIALAMVTLSIVPVALQRSSDKVVPVRLVVFQSCS